MVKNELLAKLRPNDRADMLRKAFGESWKEPNKSAEGYIFDDNFLARITIDDKIGEIAFQQPFPVDIAIAGITLGSTASSFDKLYPNAIVISNHVNDYGWSFKRIVIEQGVNEGFDFTVGIKDGLILSITLTDPNAIYPERPYKYADPLLTDAFNLEISSPVSLKDRPKDGWCYGLPPAIGADRWPISSNYGTPLRHAFTLKLPEQYRTQGTELVAISLFVDEMFDEALPLIRVDRLPVADKNRFDMEYLGCQYSLFWLTEEEYNGPLGRLPELDPKLPRLGWLHKSPIDYFGKETLPLVAFNKNSQYGLLDAFDIQKPSDFEQLKSDWVISSADEALKFGFPIKITRRENDPNVGRPARELESQNAFSDYIPVLSDKGRELNLIRFYECDAHLGGTMCPVQIYPDFSPYYLEFSENLGGFNFGFGVAQLDLKQMLINWSC